MMKKRNIILKIVLFSLLINFCTPLFAEDIKDTKDDIPQVMQDIRRFEIITLGSLPFVILDANLAYSGYKYFANGMNSSDFPSLSPTLSKEEQQNLFFTSMGISVGIGLTDLIVNIVKRSIKNKKKEPEEKPINITPISENPNATKLPSFEELNQKKSDAVEIIEDDN